MGSPPIVPQDYMGGVKVVDIGEARVRRGKTDRPLDTCRHLRTVFDDDERRIWCKDCESDVDPYDAFKLLVENFDRANQALSKRQREVEESEQATIRSRATKLLDKIWRSRKSVPCCPHCKEGLLAEDFITGVIGEASKELTLRKRTKNS